MSNGKGSARRPGNAKAYAEGWARIFGQPKKVVPRVAPKYPPWTCSTCAESAGGCLRNPEGTTWHVGYCPLCDRREALTEPRDYGWPDFK